jgi:hypothetical protein
MPLGESVQVLPSRVAGDEITELLEGPAGVDPDRGLVPIRSVMTYLPVARSIANDSPPPSDPINTKSGMSSVMP